MFGVVSFFVAKYLESKDQDIFETPETEAGSSSDFFAF
jgi:hypothetical protein